MTFHTKGKNHWHNDGSTKAIRGFYADPVSVIDAAVLAGNAL